MKSSRRADELSRDARHRAGVRIATDVVIAGADLISLELVQASRHEFVPSRDELIERACTIQARRTAASCRPSRGSSSSALGALYYGTFSCLSGALSRTSALNALSPSACEVVAGVSFEHPRGERVRPDRAARGQLEIGAVARKQWIRVPAHLLLCVSVLMAKSDCNRDTQ